MEELDKIGTEFDIKHLQTKENEDTPKSGPKASKKLD